jgi:hypothetical protein
MALTFVEVFKTNGLETKRMHAYNVSLDSSYPTGGEVIAPGDVGLTRIDECLPATGTLGYQFEWDQTNKKLIVYQGDNTNAAAAPGIQVPNTTNLAALVNILCLFFGV